jgi:hypothetical protein
MKSPIDRGVNSPIAPVQAGRSQSGLFFLFGEAFRNPVLSEIVYRQNPIEYFSY